ncbi:exopolysaccharide biosynthesis protein [Sphingomonas segetis]|uniref:exopolysaccharide biosynthesis protein n=1 Tax=Sphingomonas segetis TaxID=1104779 RepID=UPI0012D2E4F5|nr:exopolysaccharide biosynthesis protein [Sphingomonas segetis]
MDIAGDQPRPSRMLPLSQRLAQIIAEDGPDRLSFSDLAAQLHARAWGGLLLIFGAIDLLPLPPLTSVFFALPMLVVSAQMVIGRPAPWFPRKLEQRGVTKQELGRLVGKMAWLELRIERIFKPRISTFTGPVATRIIGGLCFLLALVAAVPIPMFHFAPAAAIVLFGLALIYRDGALAIVAAVAAGFSLVLNVLIITTGVLALTYVAGMLAFILDALGLGTGGIAPISGPS